MASKSGIHVYTEWAKSRLDEMDAAVSSMEASIEDLRAQARANAETALADMKARRDAFSAQIDDSRNAGESAWADAQTQMQANWNAFEAAAKSYMSAAADFAEQNRAAYHARAEAQMKAWQDTVSKLQGMATDFSGERKAEVESATEKMKREAELGEGPPGEPEPGRHRVMVGDDEGAFGLSPVVRKGQRDGLRGTETRDEVALLQTTVRSVRSGLIGRCDARQVNKSLPKLAVNIARYPDSIQISVVADQSRDPVRAASIFPSSRVMSSSRSSLSRSVISSDLFFRYRSISAVMSAR